MRDKCSFLLINKHSPFGPFSFFPRRVVCVCVATVRMNSCRKRFHVYSSRRFVRILVYVTCKGTEQGLFEVGGCAGASPITAVAIGSGSAALVG